MGEVIQFRPSRDRELPTPAPIISCLLAAALVSEAAFYGFLVTALAIHLRR